MNVNDLTVEVRDKSLTRLGAILPQDLNLDASDVFNNTGTWKLSLPVEHPLAPYLRQPGAGIVISDSAGVEIFSGPTVKPELAQTPEDLRGTVTVEGITDDHILADQLAYPQPSNGDATSQAIARDERTGSPETLMHQFVNANIGTLAPANRRKQILTLGPDLARPAGVSISKGARFPTLGELLLEIATPHDLGFRVIQRGDVLRFETFEIVDRSKTVRLDVLNGTLSSQRVATAPPGATRVIVAGQDEGVDRQFLTADTPASILAEDQWGRRIERFIDQRQTDNWDELQQAADEVLAEEGLTQITVQIVPTESSNMRFGEDWFLGDRISVVSDSQEVASVVTGSVIKVGPEGVKTGALVGDPTGYNPNLLVQKELRKTKQRLSSLERSAVAAEGGQSANFTITSATTTWTLVHNFNQSTVTVDCFDANGKPVIGDVSFPDANTATVTWYYATAGSARVRS